jgi:hypothetical protein
LAILNQILEKCVNHSRLAESHVARDSNDASVPFARQFERATQFLPLVIAADNVIHWSGGPFSRAGTGSTVWEGSNWSAESIS